MTKALWKRWRVLLGAMLLILVAVGITGILRNGSDQPYVASSDWEPTSTDQLRGPGLAVIEPIGSDDLPALSDAAVELTVLNVSTSRLNTPDGGMPEIRIDLADPTRQFDGLDVVTEVVVRVEAVHGVRDGVRDTWREGAEVTLTVAGGLVEVILPPDVATALGFDAAPEFYFEEPKPGEEALQTDPASEAYVAPNEPVSMRFGVAPIYSLTEGDTVLMFVTGDDRRLFDGGTYATLRPTHPYGVFRLSDGQWLPDLPELRGSDPLELARRIVAGP